MKVLVGISLVLNLAVVVLVLSLATSDNLAPNLVERLGIATDRSLAASSEQPKDEALTAICKRFDKAWRTSESSNEAVQRDNSGLYSDDFKYARQQDHMIYTDFRFACVKADVIPE